MSVYQYAKQRASDLMSNPDKDWTSNLEANTHVELRLDSKTPIIHELPSGKTKLCTELQWWLGGGRMDEYVGKSALWMFVDSEDGLSITEVYGVFQA